MYPDKVYQAYGEAYKAALENGCKACPAYNSERFALGTCGRSCKEEILLALKAKYDWQVEMEQRWLK